MKTIVINASPRKNWNTALMLKEAQKGAESAGAETEYIDLYDLDFTGCRSCLACKRKGAERCRCYWPDDFSPVIAKILAADCLIIGTPIYFNEPTAGFRALLERLCFCVLSYDGGKNYYEGNLKIGIIYTMNCPRDFYESAYRPSLERTEGTLKRLLSDTVKTTAACETLQVEDYSKFSMGRFDPEQRRAGRETQFPKDLKAAYELGAELARQASAN